MADIGDNDAERKYITLYRIPEPSEPTGAAAADIFHATYPDGAHDAETLLVTVEGRLLVVTKGDTGPVALYQFPNDLREGTPVQLERLGFPRDAGQPPPGDRITDGAISPDGRWIVLRSTEALMFYPATNLLTGTWREAVRVPLNWLGEPQGEGVAVATDGSIYLISEGGGEKQPGSFARLTCTLPQ